jgi:hypothetical protein
VGLSDCGREEEGRLIQLKVCSRGMRGVLRSGAGASAGRIDRVRWINYGDSTNGPYIAGREVTVARSINGPKIPVVSPLTARLVEKEASSRSDKRARGSAGNLGMD